MFNPVGSLNAENGRRATAARGQISDVFNWAQELKQRCRLP
jgi:hypothetical protein